MTGRVIALLVALAVSGCASKSWVGTYAPVDGAWEMPAGSAPLLTLDAQTEADGRVTATGKITDRASRAMPVTMVGDDRGLFAAGVDLGAAGLTLPDQQGSVDGAQAPIVHGARTVKGRARISLHDITDGLQSLQVTPDADSGATVDVLVVRPKAAKP